MKLKEKLLECQQSQSALLATNFYNFETLRGVLEAAKTMDSPIILQLTRSSIEYMGLENAIGMGKEGLKYYNVEGWIHLDHGDSIDLVEKCLHAGFDSVMIDGSELPMEENIELARKVVNLSKPFDVNVEAELGYVAKLGQDAGKVEYTRPEDVKYFVDETWIDALAVAIGTAHGFYKEIPKLDFNRLAAIRETTNVKLVLHGGSGVPDDSVRRAIQNGICKVNVATEIKDTFMKNLKQTLNTSDEIDLRKVFPHAILAVNKLIQTKLNLMH